MPTISQIQIGDTTYDIKDTVARNKPRPQIKYIDTQWRNRLISNHTHWCGNQMIVDTCSFRGVLLQLSQGHASFTTQTPQPPNGTWGQIHLYLAHREPARSSVELWDGGNAGATVSGSGTAHWSEQKAHIVKGNDAESYQWCDLHTFSMATYTNKSNFSSRTTPCATFNAGHDNDIAPQVHQWSINLYANYIFIYFPLHDNDKTELSDWVVKDDNVYWQYYFTVQSDFADS